MEALARKDMYVPQRMEGMGSTRYYFARRRVGKKNQIHWNERRKVSLKMVQEMPG